MLRPQPHELGAGAGDMAQPQHGPPADGTAFRLDGLAALADEVEDEGRSGLAQRVDGALQLGGGLRRQPGAEGEHPPRRGQVGHQRHVAGNVGFVTVAAPDDDYMGVEAEQFGAAVEREAQLVDLPPRALGVGGGAGARAQEADGGDHAEDDDADIEPEGGPFMGADRAEDLGKGRPGDLGRGKRGGGEKRRGGCGQRREPFRQAPRR